MTDSSKRAAATKFLLDSPEARKEAYAFPSVKDWEAIYDRARSALARLEPRLLREGVNLVGNLQIDDWVVSGVKPAALALSADLEICSVFNEGTYFLLTGKDISTLALPGRARLRHPLAGFLAYSKTPVAGSQLLSPDLRAVKGRWRLLFSRGDLPGILAPISWEFPVSSHRTEVRVNLSSMWKSARQQMTEEVLSLGNRLAQVNLPPPAAIAHALHERLSQLFIPASARARMHWTEIELAHVKLEEGQILIFLIKKGRTLSSTSIAPACVSLPPWPGFQVSELGRPFPGEEFPQAEETIPWQKRHAREVEQLSQDSEPQGTSNVAWFLAWEIYDRLCQKWATALERQGPPTSQSPSFRRRRQDVYESLLNRLSEDETPVPQRLRQLLNEQLALVYQPYLNVEGARLKAEYSLWLMADSSAIWELKLARAVSMRGRRHRFSLNGWLSAPIEGAKQGEITAYASKSLIIRMPDRYQETERELSDADTVAKLTAWAQQCQEITALIENTLKLLIKRAGRKLLEQEVQGV